MNTGKPVDTYRRLGAGTLSLCEEGSHKWVIARVGNGIRISEAVGAALWAFLRYWRTSEQCLIRAVGFGGDTDTIGAMAGALVGLAPKRRGPKPKPDAPLIAENERLKRENQMHLAALRAPRVLTPRSAAAKTQAA